MHKSRNLEDNPGPLRVFISYTAKDLTDFARVISEVIQRLEWVSIDHRLWSASGRPTVEWCLEKVRGCDILVVLVAQRYGWVPGKEEGGDGKKSITWMEVEEAKKTGMEVIPFLLDSNAPWPQPFIETLDNPAAGKALKRFKSVLEKTICGYFSTPESLGKLAYQSISRAGKRLLPGKSQLGPLSGDPINTYLSLLKKGHSHLELMGFGEEINVHLPIDQVFVPLFVALSRFPREFNDLQRSEQDRLEKGGNVSRDVPLESAFQRAQNLGKRGIVLLGDPGSGKTTIVHYLVWRCVDSKLGVVPLGLPADIIPIHIPLRRLGEEYIDIGLQEFFARELCPVYLPDEPDFCKLIENRPLLWILDGLDEVADTKIRARISRRIMAEIKSRPKDHFFVTCRHASYLEETVLGSFFMEFHVQPLNDEQVQDFISRWYTAVELQYNPLVAEASRLAAKRSAGLTRILHSTDFRNRRLASMIANPLLLSILCLVHRKNLKLPKLRSELYSKCIEILLDHWRYSKGLASFEFKSTQAVLAPVAWWIHQEKDRTEVPAARLVEVVKEPLGTMARKAKLETNPEAFLAGICEQCGLLVRPDPGSYSFLHLCFQEYLAAVYACEERLEEQLAIHFHHSWWREVILLAVGMASRTFSRKFFKAIIQSGFLENNLELASLCLAESQWVPLESFLEELRDYRCTPERIVNILRLLRTQEDKRLVDACLKLKEHHVEEVRLIAWEILLRSGQKNSARVPEKSSIQINHSSEILPGTERIVEPSGIIMVYIPGGEFMMGCEDENVDERPVRLVRLSPFWISKYPVTNYEYDRFLEMNPDQRKPRFWAESLFNKTEQPVVGVSWENAQVFCRWANLYLPTEAQWEYACRAGSVTNYWSGNAEEDLARVGWYEGNSKGRVHPVGEKNANPFGLYDIHGNVWEWCEDWYGTYDVNINKKNPINRKPANFRVMRGGCFRNSDGWARSASRNARHPESRCDDLSFRVMLPVLE